MKKKIVGARRAWLTKHKLTPRQFAEATGQYVGTVYTWFKYGRTPRRKYLEPVLAVYPDWPVA